MTAVAQPSPAPSRRKIQRALELFPDAHLVKRAVRNAGAEQPRRPRWEHVGRAFDVGAELAVGLCRRFDLDPNEHVGGSRARSRR